VTIGSYTKYPVGNAVSKPSDSLKESLAGKSRLYWLRWQSNFYFTVLDQVLINVTCLFLTYGFYPSRQWADLSGPSHHSKLCRFRRKWHGWRWEFPLPGSPT